MFGGGAEGQVGSPEFTNVAWTSLNSGGFSGGSLWSSAEGWLYCFQQS
jgi:hypothetical protein